MSRRSVGLVSFAFFVLALVPGGARAGTGATIVAEPIATGLEAVTSFTIGPGGRFYYVERTSGEVNNQYGHGLQPEPADVVDDNGWAHRPSATRRGQQQVIERRQR